MTRRETVPSRGFWQRMSLPLKVGLVCGGLGIVLAIVGIARGMVPLRPLSIFMALLISGGTWGIVSWAVATAAVDVEQEVVEAESVDQEVEQA